MPNLTSRWPCVPLLEERLRPAPEDDVPAPGLKDDERGGGRGGDGMTVEEGVLVEVRLTAIMILAQRELLGCVEMGGCDGM